MKHILGASALCLALVAGFVTNASAASSRVHRATAQVVNLQGKVIGQVNLRSTPKGVLIEMNLNSLPPGVHAIHLHAAGRCDTKGGFASAGADFSPDPKRKHGFITRGGAHAGDLPNQVAAKDGTLRATILTNQFTLGYGKKSIFDKDGTAFVVHARGDDYMSQPAGNAGPAIACGIIRRHGAGAPQQAQAKRAKAAAQAVPKRQKT